MAQRVGRGIALLFHDLGTRRGGGQQHAPAALYPGGPQGRSGRAENLVSAGIRSRTVQPVAQSLYRLSYPAHLYGVYSAINGIKQPDNDKDS